MTDYMKEAERLLDEYIRVARLWMAQNTGDAEMAARTALLAHIQRGAVPEGYVAVPRFLAENHRNLTDVPRYQRILDECLAAAPAPDQFRDAAEIVAEPADDRIAAALHYPECWDTAAYPTVESALSEVYAHYRCTEHDAPAEVPMPEPDTSDISGYTPHALRTYGAAREAAGCARVLEWAVSRWKSEVENRPLENKNRRPLDDVWRQVVRFAGGDPDALLGPSHDAALRGEVKP